MKIEIVSKSKLKRPPTDVCEFQNKIYVSTKGKRVFYSSDMKTFKSIVFSEQVNSLCSNSELIFALQKDGMIFGLNNKHKSAFKIKIGDSPCIFGLFNSQNDELLVGSENMKISVFSPDGILKNTLYSTEGPLVYFDTSDKLIARCSLNCQNIEFSSLKDKFTIKILDGFPEILKFASTDTLLIGSSTGTVSSFSVLTKKRISFLKLENEITAIHIINSKTFLVGCPGYIYLIDFSNFNKMEIIDQIKVDGIPIAFCGTNDIYCGISRESRLGRWKKFKNGNNSVIKISII